MCPAVYNLELPVTPISCVFVRIKLHSYFIIFFPFSIVPYESNGGGGGSKKKRREGGRRGCRKWTKRNEIQ